MIFFHIIIFYECSVLFIYTICLVEDKEELEIDLNYATNEYHVLLNVGVCLAVSEFKKPSYEILLMGLGGGVLATLLHKCFKEASNSF